MSKFLTALTCAFALQPACLPAFPQAAQPIGYSIAGTVVNSATGSPVPRATMAVLSEADSHTIESVETDNDGRFSLDGLAAAKFQLTASKRGFLTAFYDQHEEFNSAIVTGEDQDTSGLVFRLTPGAVLHGMVTGDGGDPAEGAKVLLFLKPSSHNPGARITQATETATDDTGDYDFTGLAPGEYMVAVTAEPWYALHRNAGFSGQRPDLNSAATLDVTYPTTYFDSTTDEATATTIILTGGSREEANINLRAVPALHLQVEIPKKQDGSPTLAQLRRTIFGTEASIEQKIPPFGRMNSAVEFTGVAPGHYELTQGDPPRIAELDATTSQQIDPSLGTPAIAVSGTLRTTNGSSLPDHLSVTLNSLDPVQPHAPLESSCIQGSFSFAAVLPGKWELVIDSSGNPLPIVSIAIGGRPYTGNQFTVRDQPLRLMAMVSRDETRIEGFARKQGKGRAGVMMVLVPKNLAAFPSLARRDQSDSDGSFALRNVAPGQYILVAIEGVWDVDWARPEMIRRYLPLGTPVTVTGSSGKLLRLAEAVPVQSR
jgi:5-hydroxyisourate hydrolase-like protein (transthyretin family)